MSLTASYLSYSACRYVLSCCLVVSAVEQNLAEWSAYRLDRLWRLVFHTIAASFRELKPVPAVPPHAVDATELNSAVCRAFGDSFQQDARSQLL